MAGKRKIENSVGDGHPMPQNRKTPIPMTDKRFRLSDDAFATFEGLKAEETKIDEEKKKVLEARSRDLEKLEARARERRNITASFLNGWAASAGVPPGHLFIEEYGEFRLNRKRAVKKKKKIRGRSRGEAE